MTDLAKTQDQWTRFAGTELGFFLGLLRLLKEGFDTFALERTQLVPYDTTGNLDDGMTLAGLDPDDDFDADGFMILRVIDNGGSNFTLEVYKATGGGGGNLVASGSGNTTTTATLAEANDSGVTGTWEVPAGAVADATDDIRIYSLLDWRLRLLTTWDGSTDKDVQSRDDAKALLDTIRDGFGTALANVRATVSLWATGDARRGPDFLGLRESALAADSARVDDDGNVTRRRTGFLPALRLAMIDETVGGTQSVLESISSAAAGVFASGNDGQGTLAAHTPFENHPPGLWTWQCAQGKNDGRGGTEEFSGSFKQDDSDATLTVSGLRVGQLFSGPLGFGPVSLLRAPAKTSDGTDLNFDPVASLAVSDEDGNNTDGGILYWRVDEPSAGSFDLSFFNSPNRLEGDLVAKATGVAAAAVFSATSQNGSGIQVDWTAGSAPVDLAEGTVDLNFFVSDNGSGVADQFTVSVTKAAAAGLIQTLIGEQLLSFLNSETSGSETIPDAFVKASAFVPRVVVDN